MNNKKFPVGNETEFNKFLVREYLKYGSVDEVFRIHRFELPISYAGYQRVLNKWGIVKAAGPNSKLSETISFISKLSSENIPFEELYKKMPPSFQTSASTLYRILSYMREGLTRRVGTALIISPFDDSHKILVARDVSTPRIELGKPYGSTSLPMGYARKIDSRKSTILRILQQEVFSQKAVENEIPNDIVRSGIAPFLYLDIVDVRVSVYHIQLPKSLSGIASFSSRKLQDYKYMSLEDILQSNPIKENFRVGLMEAVEGYKKYLELLNRRLEANPQQVQSLLNREVVAEVVIER